MPLKRIKNKGNLTVPAAPAKTFKDYEVTDIRVTIDNEGERCIDAVLELGELQGQAFTKARGPGKKRQQVQIKGGAAETLVSPLIDAIEAELN